MISREFNRENRAPREDMDQVHYLMESGDRVGSINLIRELLLDYPSDVYLYMHAATSFLKLSDAAYDLGKQDEAGELMQNSLDYALAGLKIKDSDVRLLTHAGKIFRQTAEYDKSESFYLRALRIRYDDKFTWTAIGDLYAIWARDENADLDDEQRRDMRQDATNCYAQASMIQPDPGIYRRLDDMAKEGFRPTPEGFDIGDDALKLIRQTHAIKPQHLPAPSTPTGPA